MAELTLNSFAGDLRESIRQVDSSRAELPDSQFGAMALQLFQLQFENNQPYRKYCEKLGSLPANVRRWQDIPCVSTSTYKHVNWSSILPNERTNVFLSSGTTEQKPSRHFHHRDSLALYEISAWTWFRRNFVLEPMAQILFLTPRPDVVPCSSLVHMFAVVAANVGITRCQFAGMVTRDGSWTVDTHAVSEACKKAQAEQTPLAILGTAFNFVHLLDALPLENQNFALPPGSQIMETGGYKGRSRQLSKSELHELLGRRFGLSPASIVTEYGMCELSSQAYITASRSFRFPPWARVRIISPETGKEVADGDPGLIAVYDLANVWSILAVQTEDLAMRRGGGFELLGRASAVEDRGCSLMSTSS